MAIALRVLAVDEEPLRNHQMKVVLCAGHRDVELSAFLLDLGRGAGAEVGRHAAVDDVEQID
jgi:tRNA(Ile)-lysidine synthase TilS/MesJ